jgi:hypothetical protein
MTSRILIVLLLLVSACSKGKASGKLVAADKTSIAAKSCKVAKQGEARVIEVKMEDDSIVRMTETKGGFTGGWNIEIQRGGSTHSLSCGSRSSELQSVGTNDSESVKGKIKLDDCSPEASLELELDC